MRVIGLLLLLVGCVSEPNPYLTPKTQAALDQNSEIQGELRALSAEQERQIPSSSTYTCYPVGGIMVRCRRW